MRQLEKRTSGSYRIEGINRYPTTYLYPLFEHMSKNHGLVLIDDEMHDIIQVVELLGTVGTTDASPPNAAMSDCAGGKLKS